MYFVGLFCLFGLLVCLFCLQKINVPEESYMKLMANGGITVSNIDVCSFDILKHFYTNLLGSQKNKLRCNSEAKRMTFSFENWHISFLDF